MKGKQRCKILKEIRQKIAEANDIEYITSECRHKGDCLGTCPKCEAELQYLERELEKRQRLGKTVAVAGLTAIIATSAVGCDDWFPRETGGDPLPPEGYEELDGDIALPPEEIELSGDMPVPPEEELMGEPAWPDLPENGDCAPDIIDDTMTADELKNVLLYSGITREGLYNSRGWADLFISTDEDGNDLYRCPIEGYETMTIIYQREDNGMDFVIDVQFHEEGEQGNSTAIVLPEDSLS